MAMMRKRSRGYTLIEVMVALFVFAIVASIIGAALQNTYRLRARLSSQDQTFKTITKMLLIMERDVEFMVNEPITNAAGNSQPSLVTKVGRNSKTVTFSRGGYVRAPDEPNQSHLLRVQYVFRQGTLHRLTWPRMDRLTDQPDSDVVLASGIVNIDWQFIDDKRRRFSLWPPVAQMENTLPRAVILNITFDNQKSLTRTWLLGQNETFEIANNAGR